MTKDYVWYMFLDHMFTSCMKRIAERIFFNFTAEYTHIVYIKTEHNVNIGSRNSARGTQYMPMLHTSYEQVYLVYNNNGCIMRK